MPKGLQKRKLKNGKMLADQREKFWIRKWKDKTGIFLWSTIHNTEMVELGRMELKKFQ